VYRLVTGNSVEERILLRAREKHQVCTLWWGMVGRGSKCYDNAVAGRGNKRCDDGVVGRGVIDGVVQ
jgi:hypothetical protein